ncbi:MAG: hypothetical protein FWF82_07450, partial [Oscillospiraceae bacterium]|nr:hypothetical protein [Oscillospiraceae bacterium]
DEYFTYTLYYVSKESWGDPTEDGVFTHAIAELKSHTRTLKKSDGLIDFSGSVTIKSVSIS